MANINRLSSSTDLSNVTRSRSSSSTSSTGSTSSAPPPSSVTPSRSSPELFRSSSSTSISTLPSSDEVSKLESGIDSSPPGEMLRRSQSIPKPLGLSGSHGIPMPDYPPPPPPPTDLPPPPPRVPTTDPQISMARMERASELRKHIKALDEWQPEPGMKAKDVQKRQGEINAIKNSMQGELDQLKQEIIDEIVTPEIRSMPNSPEKAQAVFQSFLSRGIYQYQTTTSGQVDLLAGDTRAACGNIATAFARCLREAGFPSDDVRGNHRFNHSGGNGPFLTRPIDADFIDQTAIGNVRTEGGSLEGTRRYLFSQHYITRLEGVGYFCPTSGKFAATEEGLADQLVETPLRSAGTTYTGGGHTVALVAGQNSARGEGIYNWTSS